MNWLRKKNERKTKEDGDSIYSGLAAAVAAAAFAVQSLEQDETRDNNKAKTDQLSNGFNSRFSFNKIKSRAQSLTRQTSNQNQKKPTRSLSSNLNEPKESGSDYRRNPRRNGKLKSFLDSATAKRVNGEGKKG